MTQNLADEKTEAVMTAATAARTTLKRALDLTAEDVSSIAVEPIMEALGWTMRDPRVVRRGPGSTITLLDRGQPFMRIRAVAAHGALPGSLSQEDVSQSSWYLLTNGLKWAIFNTGNPYRAFRQFSIEDTAATRSSLDILAMLDRDAIKPDALAEAWKAEAIDGMITQSLMRHLDASDDLLEILQTDLGKNGLKISSDDIRGALSRIEITLPGADAQPQTAAGSGQTKSGQTRAKPGPKPKTADSGAAPGTALETSAAPGARTTKPAAKPGPKPKTGKPDLPEGVEWPQKASYVMQRKKTIAFASHDGRTGKITLHPGSRISTKTRKTMPHDLELLREDARQKGKLIDQGDTLELTEAMDFDTHRSAATFAAGSDVKAADVWRTPSGATLADKLRAKKRPGHPARKSQNATTPQTTRSKETVAESREEETESA